MGFSDYLWFAIKVAVSIYILKKILNKVVEMIINKILYVPDFPSVEYKFPENNPPKWRSPSEYGYEFEELEIITKDKIKLAGWAIYQDKPKEYPTIIFSMGMQEILELDFQIFSYCLKKAKWM